MHRDNTKEDRSILVVGIGGNVLGLDRATGEERWRVEVDPRFDGGTGTIELVVHRGRVIATGSTKDIVFIDYLTGEELARIQTSGGKGRASMLVDGDVLIVGKEGRIDCYTLDGDYRWENGLKGLGYGELALGFPDNVRQADQDRS